MNSPKTLQDYREELSGWKLTALCLSATGRFKGYEPAFHNWINQLTTTLNAAHTPSIALHELAEAKRRINAANDDLFPDICDRLDRTLLLAQDIAYQIPGELLDEFHAACKQDNVEPTEKVVEFMRMFLERRRQVMPGTTITS